MIRLVALVALLSLSACTFSKIQVNKSLKDMDVSSIEVGETTWREVLRTLGPPAPTGDQENPLKNASARHLKYVFFESKYTAFLFGYIAILRFDWTDDQSVRELLVEFDEDGVVSGIFRTTNDTIWRPLQGEGSRDPQVNEDLSKGAGS